MHRPPTRPDRRRRRLMAAGFFLACASLGLATGRTVSSLTAGLIAAIAAAACFTFAHRQENS